MSKNTSPYHEAGNIINELLSSKSGGRGLKSIIFSKNKTKGGPNKATYATVCKSMQHIPTINAVLNENGGKLRKAIGLDTVHNKGLMYVMLYELLFSKYRSIRGGGKLKRMIIKHEQELREGINAHVSKNGAGTALQFPRYVRVNVLQTSVEQMVKGLKESLAEKYASGSDGIDDSKRIIFADAHVPDLLVLHPSVSSFLHQDNEYVKSGKLILQDKSSCFSALALALGNTNTPVNCDFIDACSAPGNKTTHLAALVSTFYTDQSQPKKKKGKKPKPNSTIFAFERSSSRFKVLKSRVDTLIPSPEVGSSPKVAVEPLLGDFLKSDPNNPKFANVRGILLDPSCSGSGIVNSPDRWLEDGEVDGSKSSEEEKAKRIQSLANFQLVALKHAMSFPLVERIVYSTCSVHNEENEEVVGKALSEVNESMQMTEKDEWQLVSPACLSHWQRRGKPGVGGLSECQARCLIRCDGLDGDETNGFFVSYFERKRVGGVTELEATKKPINCHELPVYQGEFSKINDEMKESIPSTTNTTNEDGLEPKSLPNKEKQCAATKQHARSETDKSHQKIAKKKAKKLAWKQKQALQKAQRLKEKKDKATADSSK